MKRYRGFTLLELLVSISIFSVLGLSAYQLLETVSNSHELVRENADTWTEAGFTMSMLQRDFNQFIDRPVRDIYGEPRPPMMFEQEVYQVEFTRQGWSNPAGRPRSRLQRVAYRVDYDEETLVRAFWEVLDRAEDSEPVEQVLMTGVTDFRVVGFVDDTLESTGVDQPGLSDDDLEQAGQVVPAAVEVVLATENTGDIRRVFQLADTLTPGPSGQEDESRENDSAGQ